MEQCILCPFCLGCHRGMFWDELEAEVLACRDAHPEKQETAAQWAGRDTVPNVCWMPEIQTPVEDPCLA